MAWREVPSLWRADFGDVPADRARDGIAVCGGVSRVRHNPGDGKVAVLYVLDSYPDGDGFACEDASGHGQRAGVCGGIALFRVCAANPGPLTMSGSILT